jgi:hypothetical protein
VTNQIKPELLNSKTELKSVYDKLRDLKNNLSSDYEVRRKLVASPPIQDKLFAILEETISDDRLTAKQS